MPTVEIGRSDSILIVTINRPETRNAVDAATAVALADAFRSFDADDTLHVAVLTGAGETFCAGADLKAIAAGRLNALSETGDGPMGPTRMLLSKPAIAAIEGYAVAGGLELALWCDLRVVARDATLGVFCRRFGVPLIDLGDRPAAAPHRAEPGARLDSDRARGVGRGSAAHGTGQPAGGIRPRVARRPGTGADARRFPAEMHAVGPALVL
jgi:hypothetical protein